MSVITLIADNMEWGMITRDYGKALLEFSTKSEYCVEKIRENVQHFGIRGQDDFVTQISASLRKKIDAIAGDIEKIKEIVPQLEEKAKGYDEAVQKLKEALDTLR